MNLQIQNSNITLRRSILTCWMGWGGAGGGAGGKGSVLRVND